MCQEYKHLNLDERIEIEKGIDAGKTLTEIAQLLGRSVSTISREARRNAWRPGNESASYTPYRGQGRKRETTTRQYRAGPAQRAAQVRAAHCHQRRALRTDRSVGWVCRKIKEEGWTAEQAAGRVRLEFPDDRSMWFSHETLYQFAYAKENAHHRLPEYFPRHHAKRRRKHGRRVHQSGIDRRVSISQRPCEVTSRTVFGHWEGDSVEGLRSVGDGIHTEVERMSRFLAARKVPRITSQAASDAQLVIFSALPAPARRSTTLDNGRENHLHHRLVDELGMSTWFAHPYSSFERGSNERVNGLIRRWLPKGSDLSTVTDEDLAWIVDKINHAPLKMLGWHTPAEAFSYLLDHPDQPRLPWASPARGAAAVESAQHANVALPT